MTEEKMRKLGWHQWYNDKYWVHSDSVENPTTQDYTDFGFTFEEAVKYEHLGRPKFKQLGMPILSKVSMAIRTKGLTQVPDTEALE